MKFFVVYLLRYGGSFCIFIFFSVLSTQLSAEKTISDEEITSEEKSGDTTFLEDNELLKQPNTTARTEYSTEEENFPILDESKENTVAIKPIGFWDTVRVFVMLGIVILGIYVFVWALKKFQSRSFARSEIIDVLTSQQLSGGGNVHLIKLGKSLFFIGASNQGVTLMKEIRDKEEIDEIDLSLSVVEGEKNKRNSFYQKIEHIFKTGAKKKSHSKNKNSYQKNSVQETFEIIKSVFRRQTKRGKELDA